jgi:signal transduction histidine kinase
VVKRLFARRSVPSNHPTPSPEPPSAHVRWETLIEESPELVVVVDDDRNVIAASRRAKRSLEKIVVGEPLPPEALSTLGDHEPLEVPYRVGDRRETLVYLGRPGDLSAYQELRAGFTAAVSHELRTPLARIMVLIDSLTLPGSDVEAIADQTRSEVRQIGELIDDVLFLSELESGKAVVSLGSTAALPILEEVIGARSELADIAGVELTLHCDPEVELPLRPRMIETIAANLVENAIRYAGPGSTFTLAARLEDGATVLIGSDTGTGVSTRDLPRLFERFFRSDQARSSYGTGLGLAIVKHIVTAAGGTAEARNRRRGGLEVRCTFLP